MFYYGTKNGTDYGAYLEPGALQTYVELNDNEWLSLVNRANSEGKLIVTDENGYPVLTNPPEPSLKEQTETRIIQLENYLTSTDWYVVRYQETGTPEPEDIRIQRASAREEISNLRELLNGN